MQFGSESEVVRARWLAAGAFIALSLPLAFVGEPQVTSQHRTLLLPPPTVTPVQPGANLTAAARPIAKATAKPKRIVVSISERKLAVIEKKGVVKTYPIAVGADASPSPTGQFKIVNKVTDPTYYSPGSIISPGPANPLGTRWLGLDKEHYGIHGTNEPESIGQAASRGCIRMAQTDVEELFTLAGIGDSVEISHEPLEQLAQLDEVASDVGQSN